MTIKEIDKKYIANTYARFPVTITSGQGAILTDDEGKDYIDMGSGIGVNIFGASDKQWLEAVREQLAKLQHTSNLYY
ncbi:MAG: aminotransferase class III-fold pyridoxal phosphate-dependent enzyme, partial [Eubacteriales bacterium]